MDREIWLDVNGFEGLYQVSNLGRVRSLDRYYTSKDGKTTFVKGRVLRLCKTNRYTQCTLSKNGVHYQRPVHRLVAETFLPEHTDCQEVNHIDENTLNNCVENLEWVSHKDNINHGTGNERRRIHNIESQPSKSIIQYTIDGEIVRRFSSLREMARETSFDRKTIGLCCRGEYKQSHWFIWRYE